MSKYFLITFYNRGTEETPIWSVYGHYSEGHNDFLGEYPFKDKAIEKAHSYVAPVLQGAGNSYKAIELLQLKQLQDENERLRDFFQ